MLLRLFWGPPRTPTDDDDGQCQGQKHRFPRRRRRPRPSDARGIIGTIDHDAGRRKMKFDETPNRIDDGGRKKVFHH
jgi:hypothetical protein